MQRPMRRQDRAVTDPEAIHAIVRDCRVFRLGLVDEGEPYIVPMNFGYTFADDRFALYFHGAREGRKIDAMRAHPRVCFEMDTGHQLIEAEESARYSFAFASVIGYGTVEFLETPEAKREGLRHLMAHQTGRAEPFHFPDAALNATAVFRLPVDEISGKIRPLPPPPPPSAETIKACADLWLAASVAGHDFIPASFWANRYEEMRTKYLPAARLEVLCEGETPIGFSATVGNTLEALFVHPDHWRKGYGQRLLQTLFTRHGELDLAVYARNELAIAFYKRNGFVETGRGVCPHTGADEIKMCWRKARPGASQNSGK